MAPCRRCGWLEFPERPPLQHAQRADGNQQSGDAEAKLPRNVCRRHIGDAEGLDDDDGVDQRNLLALDGELRSQQRPRHRRPRLSDRKPSRCEIKNRHPSLPLQINTAKGKSPFGGSPQ